MVHFVFLPVGQIAWRDSCFIGVRGTVHLIGLALLCVAGYLIWRDHFFACADGTADFHVHVPYLLVFVLAGVFRFCFLPLFLLFVSEASA